MVSIKKLAAFVLALLTSISLSMPAPTPDPTAFARVEDREISFTYTVETGNTYVASSSAAAGNQGVAAAGAAG